MKKVGLVTEGKYYTAIGMASLDKIGEYSVIHPKLKAEIIEKKVQL